MATEADTPADGMADPHHQLRHDLRTPLTSALACTQLVARMARRSSSLMELERGAMLDRLSTIETALRDLGARIDGIGRDPPDGRDDGW